VNGSGRTQLAVILEFGAEDLAVEFVAVFDGEQDRVELLDGAQVVSAGEFRKGVAVISERTA
jgi:hypothetical protein